jgi:parallel beta-helix repeat protein
MAFFSMLLLSAAALISVNGQDTTSTSITLFVTVNGTGTDCSSLEDPCGSIQQAVDVANEGAVIQIGPGTYVENVQITTAGLSLVSDMAVLESAGGVPGVEAPEDTPVDIILDILAPNTSVVGLVVRHPEGPAIHRDVGIFVRPPALDTHLEGLVVERLRTGYNLEPYTPGSRGLLVLQATHVTCLKSTFRGNYQDHIHLPTSLAVIDTNVVANATRLGIVIIQETSDSLSVHNMIKGNTVVGSASDGIQVQGDNNTIQENTVSMNGGYGIHFCGGDSNPPCVPPGETSHAAFNSATGNFFWDNDMGGEYAQDQGADNYLGQAHDTSYVHQNTPSPSTTALPTLQQNETGDATNSLSDEASGAMSMAGASFGTLGGLLVGVVSLLSSFKW